MGVTEWPLNFAGMALVVLALWGSSTLSVEQLKRNHQEFLPGPLSTAGGNYP